MRYTGRVLVGAWFDKLQLEREFRENLEKKRKLNLLPHQQVQRLLDAFTRPVPSPKEPSDVVKYNQPLQLVCPEILDQSKHFERRRGCPDEKIENPNQYGLYLAATVSPNDVVQGVKDIQDGCPLGCTPKNEIIARSIFILKKVSKKGDEEGCLHYGEVFYLQLAHASGYLYLRSEPPQLDGRFGPRDHYPLRLSDNRDCFAKWRVAHWNRRRRFETEGLPVPACSRLIIQHVMTGQCLTSEVLVWHYSLLGFECGVSVHTYTDVHRDECPECIWSFLPTIEKASLKNDGTKIA